MNAPEIHVSNVGPVVEFELAMTSPGLWVLKGRQGSGKSTIIRAVDLIVNGATEQRLTKRDGAKRGEVAVAGATMRIMQKRSEEGELTVDSLGDVSIADLHTPRFKTPETRDAHRIKTLVRLAGVKADVELFRALMPDWFDQIVPEDSLRTDDLVEMAARVKRAIEAEALRVEKREETAIANARAQATIAEGVDLDAPHDEQELQDLLERAIRNQSKLHEEWRALDERKAAALKSEESVRDARERLAKLGGGLTVTEAQAKVEEATIALDPAKRALELALAKNESAQAARQAAKTVMLEAGTAKGVASANLFGIESIVKRLEEKLALARESLAAAKATSDAAIENSNRCDERFLAAEEEARDTETILTAATLEHNEALMKWSSAGAALASAKREAELHAELMATIDASTSIVAPTEQELAMAESGALGADVGVDLAKEAITLGAKVRAARAAKELSDQHMAKAKRLKDEAQTLRDAARDTSVVLTNAIATINDCPLRVILTDDGNPRLVVATDRSDSEFFEDLSDGERWLHVVKIAAAHNRLVVLSQSAFGELSPSSRYHIDQLAKANQCWILTAEALDCELYGEPYRSEA